jgi:hypothetical protein
MKEIWKAKGAWPTLTNGVCLDKEGTSKGRNHAGHAAGITTPYPLAVSRFASGILERYRCTVPGGFRGGSLSTSEEK